MLYLSRIFKKSIVFQLFFGGNPFVESVHDIGGGGFNLLDRDLELVDLVLAYHNRDGEYPFSVDAGGHSDAYVSDAVNLALYVCRDRENPVLIAEHGLYERGYCGAGSVDGGAALLDDVRPGVKYPVDRKSVV